MKKRVIIVTILIVLSLSGIVICALMENQPANNTEPTPLPTATPTLTVVVDKDLLWNLYSDTFPKDSKVGTMSFINGEQFGARLELSAEEWETLKVNLSSNEWVFEDFSNITILQGYAEDLFNEEERKSFTEAWHRIRYAEIPKLRAVHESIEVMKDADGKALLFYFVTVYSSDSE